MKLQSMRGSDKVIARQLKDPAVRAEWERTAVARASRCVSSSTAPSTHSPKPRWLVSSE